MLLSEERGCCGNILCYCNITYPNTQWVYNPIHMLLRFIILWEGTTLYMISCVVPLLRIITLCMKRYITLISCVFLCGIEGFYKKHHSIVFASSRAIAHICRHGIPRWHWCMRSRSLGWGKHHHWKYSALRHRKTQAGARPRMMMQGWYNTVEGHWTRARLMKNARLESADWQAIDTVVQRHQRQQVNAGGSGCWGGGIIEGSPCGSWIF
jgi:hypothetical protein